MVDSPTTNYGLREQQRGTNTNTWGDTKLNEVIEDIDQILGTIKPIAITGNYSITSTNYVTTADNKNRGFKFTGALTANATITLPTTKNVWKIVNATTGGFSLLCKTAAGATVTVPASSIADVYTDAVDALNGAVNYIGARLQGVTAGTATTDAVNKTQMETAIATAGLPATAGTVLNSSTDTTAGYLSQKVTVQYSSATTTQIAGLTSLQVSTQNAGGNEKLLLTVGQGYVAGYLDGGRKLGPFTAMGGYSYAVCSGCTFLMEPTPTDMAKVRIALFNPAASYGIDPNGNKINNSTSALTGLSGGQTFETTYDATLGDWE